METSYNNWPASKTLKTRVIEPVPGVRVSVKDSNNVADIFAYLIQEFDARVEPLKGKIVDDWGFAYRENRNDPTSLSCHASGTAVDLNATKHPNGVATEKTFTPQQVRTIHRILEELDDVVRWGGDYQHTVDAMHFEIIVPPGRIKATAKAIRKKRRKQVTRLTEKIETKTAKIAKIKARRAKQIKKRNRLLGK